MNVEIGVDSEVAANLRLMEPAADEMGVRDEARDRREMSEHPFQQVRRQEIVDHDVREWRRILILVRERAPELAALIAVEGQISVPRGESQHRPNAYCTPRHVPRLLFWSSRRD